MRSPLSLRLLAIALCAASPAAARPQSSLVRDGSAWLENARISVILDKTNGQVELRYKLGSEILEGARISAMGGDGAAVRFSSIEAGAGAVAAKAATAGGQDLSFRCRILGDRPIVEIRPIAGVSALRLSYHSHCAVLPEIFGDDLIVRPQGHEGVTVLLPAEHGILHPLPSEKAILLCTWPPAPKEIPVRCATVDEGPLCIGTDIPCSAFEVIWISVLPGNAIWHEADAGKFTFSEYRKLDWKPPFPARYRCDLQREGSWSLTDSWMRQPRRDKFWMAFVGNGFPPLVEAADEIWLRIPRFRPGLPFAKNLPPALKYERSILIYPFERETDEKAGKTPDGETTVLDVIRSTLGDGWTSALDIGEGILSVEPFPKGFVFVATCGATGIAEDLFSKGKEMGERARIIAAFADMNRFVKYHRERIDAYLAFAGAWRKSIAESKAKISGSPELERAIADLTPLLDYFPFLFELSRDAIRTPDYCKELTVKAIALIDEDGPEKVKKLKELGVAMRTIGGRQDDMLWGYRTTVKAFRQRAGQIHVAAGDPAVRGLMRDLRAAARSALRICSPYEEYLFLTAAWLSQKQ